HLRNVRRRILLLVAPGSPLRGLVALRLVHRGPRRRELRPDRSRSPPELTGSPGASKPEAGIRSGGRGRKRVVRSVAPPGFRRILRSFPLPPTNLFRIAAT